jgi:hypothetical protein
MEKVILYSTHCPRCKVIETKLKQKNIVYEECNDIEIMKEKGFEMAPQLVVEEPIEIGEITGVKKTIMDFKAAVKWIGEQN